MAGSWCSARTSPTRATPAPRQTPTRSGCAWPHEAAQLGTWQWEIATGAVVWDERLEAIFGYAPGTFPQTFEAWLGGIHPDDVPEVLEIVNKAMDERSSYLLRSRVVWPDGKTVRSIESWGQVTTDADGNPTGTIGCLRDVTEEKEIERALEAAHEAQRLATRRTELLLDVTADFSGAATMRQVEEALVSHLREFSLLLGKQAALAVPEQLTEVRSGRDLALAGLRPAAAARPGPARRAGGAVPGGGPAGAPDGAHRRHRRAPPAEPGGEPAAVQRGLRAGRPLRARRRRARARGRRLVRRRQHARADRWR